MSRSRSPSRTLALPLVVMFVAACVDRGEVLAPSGDGHTTGGTDGGGATAGTSGSAGAENPPGPTLVALSLSATHAATLSASRLWSWGANESGELGQGDTLERHTPTEVVSSVRFAALAAGGDAQAQHCFTCALDGSGSAYCWGANDRGQLGQGDRTDRTSPVRVTLPAAARVITTDFSHVCAVLDDNRLFCWGRNAEGELGQDDRVPPNSDDTIRDALEPVEVPGGDFSLADAGDGHTCAIRLDGSLWCWGRNTNRQLGTSDETQIRHPIQVGTDTDWLKIDSGQQFSLALKRDHSLWGWGLNVGYATSDGKPLPVDADQIDTPTRFGTDADWKMISTRVFHSCALKQSGELWCWGRNIEGQLGTGDTVFRNEPTLVGTDIADVDTAWFTTCFLSRAGRIACTGANDHGQLGTGTTDRPLAFTDITPPE